MTDWNTNQNIGKYTILGKIGAGGMAEVFLARSKGAGGIDKLLVLKRIHPVLAINERFIEMFMEEARVAMRLNHSNIVQVYAFEQIENDYVLAMELIDGSDLLHIQTIAYYEGHRIPFGLCAFITAEIAKGLDYAHSRKDDEGEPLDLVHRDVSPQNVLISKDGAVKVTDFGIVKAKSVNEELGEVKGKLGYMSPQQARGLAVDKRADIYSLGVVLHEMLVGATKEKPGIGEFVLLDPPRSIDPTVPLKLSAITMKALQPEPEKRYQTAREMALDLIGYLKSEPEIWDSTTMEEWISKTIPEEKLLKTKLELAQASSSISVSTQAPTININSLGQFEKQIAVMVSVQIEIPSLEQKEFIQKEFDRLLQEIAYKVGGIAKTTYNSRKIFLGLPAGHFEDPISAIRLAFDLQDVVRGLSIDHRQTISCKIAVNRGHVKLGKQQIEGQFYFEASEELEKTSSLLLELAQNDMIITDSGVFRIARSEYTFLQAINLTKKSNSTLQDTSDFYGHPVKRAKSRKERNISSEQSGNDFIGRHLELAIIEEAFEKSMSGNPVLLKVTGELGLGKSSLISKFLLMAKSKGFMTLRNECLFAERDLPLASAAATIRTLLNLDDIFSRQALNNALESIYKGANTYIKRQQDFFGDILISPEATWEKHKNVQRDLIRQTAFGIGTLLSLTSSKKGTILVIDNSQWLDGPSVDVLSELARNRLNIPVFVILAGQPQMLSYRRIDNLETLELTELSDKIMKKLIASRIGNQADISEISNQILERSHGNPFFATEIIDSLILRGIIEKVPSEDNSPAFIQKKPGVIFLPSTVKGIAESKINTLSDYARTVLKAASVFGTDFSYEDLQFLLNQSVDTQKGVDELLETAFLVKIKNPEKTNLYNFKKAIEREAAYDGLSKNDCRQYHQKLARKLMKNLDFGHPIPPVRIAWHLDNSEHNELAAKYYILASDAAMDVYSSRRALRLIDRAITILPLSSKERYNALLRKERLIRDIGMHDIHIDILKEIEDIGKRFNDISMLATAAYRFSRYEYYEGNFQNASMKLEEAMRLARKSKDRDLQIEALRALGYLAIEAGKLDRSMDCCRWALTLIKNTPEDLYFKARIMGLKGLILIEMGQLEDSAYPLIYSMITFRKLGDKRNESVQLANLGILAQYRGNLIESLAFTEHALSLDREIRDVSERGRKLVRLADIRIELGQFEIGEEMLDEALKICKENFEPIGETEAELGIADLLIQKGDFSSAKDLLLDLGNKQFLSDSSISRARQRRLLSEACMKTNHIDQAIIIASEAVQIAQNSKMEAEIIHNLSLKALAHALANDGETAIKIADDLKRKLDRTETIHHCEKIWWRISRIYDLVQDQSNYLNALNAAQGEIKRKLSFIDNKKHQEKYLNHPFVKKVLNKTK